MQVRLLLKYGCNPNVRDAAGETPLHAAAAAADVPVVRMLLRAGADHRVANAAGKYPVDLLPQSCSHTLTDMLLTGDPS